MFELDVVEAAEQVEVRKALRELHRFGLSGEGVEQEDVLEVNEVVGKVEKGMREEEVFQYEPLLDFVAVFWKGVIAGSIAQVKAAKELRNVHYFLLFDDSNSVISESVKLRSYVLALKEGSHFGLFDELDDYFSEFADMTLLTDVLIEMSLDGHLSLEDIEDAGGSARVHQKVQQIGSLNINQDEELVPSEIVIQEFDEPLQLLFLEREISDEQELIN